MIMSEEEFGLLIEALRIGEEYVKEALIKEEMAFEAFLHLSSVPMMKLDLRDLQDAIELVNSKGWAESD